MKNAPLTMKDALHNATEQLAADIKGYVVAFECRKTFADAVEMAFARSILGNGLKATARKIAAFDVYAWVVKENSRRFEVSLRSPNKEQGEIDFGLWLEAERLQNEMKEVLRTME